MSSLDYLSRVVVESFWSLQIMKVFNEEMNKDSNGDDPEDSIAIFPELNASLIPGASYLNQCPVTSIIVCRHCWSHGPRPDCDMLTEWGSE